MDLTFLEGHAERRQTEAHTAHYQLTRESVYRGLQSGTTVEELLAILRDGAQTELPRNVEREIRDWARQTEQLAIHTHARLIEFPSTAMREAAMTAGLTGRRVGDTFVFTEEGAPIAALQALGAKHAIPSIDYAQPLPKCLRLLEDGTLLLPEDHTDLLLRTRLACFAERESATQWRITPASLATARSAGMTPDGILAMLQARAEGIVPPLVEVFINHVLGKSAVLQGEMVFALRIANKALYTAITTSRSLQAYLWGVCSPGTLLIRLDMLEEFRAKLEGLGVTVTD